MNQRCQEFEPLVTQWADGSLDAVSIPEVEGHLADCPACRSLGVVQRDVHHLLRSRADGLRDVAPAALRARVSHPATPRVVPFTRPSTNRRRAWRLPAAAALALAILGAGALTPGGTLLAAQLALDHLKCQWLAREANNQQPEPLEQQWMEEHGWSIDVPPSQPASQVTLTGLRRCLFHGGSMAHVHYRHGETPVSLFILPAPRASAMSLAIMGQQMVTWSDAAHTYALVGPTSDAELAAIAGQFKQHLH